jgi:cytochrome b subunit of formate dehydrogenase
MAYHLRLRKDRPIYPRFDYTEKLEYLALIWGTTVMIATGLVLWFPTLVSRYLPSWAFPVSEVIHFYEAWLAFLAILIWHFYFVFFHPEVYPMNTTWLDGKTTTEHAVHKHGKAEDED